VMLYGPDPFIGEILFYFFALFTCATIAW
jgi:hypothetical protein